MTTIVYRVLNSNRKVYVGEQFEKSYTAGGKVDDCADSSICLHLHLRTPSGAFGFTLNITLEHLQMVLGLELSQARIQKWGTV